MNGRRRPNPPPRPAEGTRAIGVPEVRAARFSVRGEELMVLSFSTVHRLPAQLTAAEEEIVRALLAGRSNAEIAAERSTSVRTVANQVASVFRKLGCASRAELAYKLGR